MSSRIRRNTGFTIVELLIVIVVIGILASISAVSYNGIQDRARLAVVQEDVNKIEDAIDVSQLDSRSYPTSITSCPTPPSGNICVVLNANNSVTYQAIPVSTGVAAAAYEFSVMNSRQFVYTSTLEKTSTNEFLMYTDVAPLIDKYGLVKYRIDFDIKSANTSNKNTVSVYMQNGSGARYSFWTNVTVTTSYTHKTIVVTPVVSNLSLTQSKLAFYGTYSTGNISTIKNVRIQLD